MNLFAPDIEKLSVFTINCFKSHNKTNKQTGKYILCLFTEIRWQSELQPVVISPKQIQLQHRFFNRKVSLIFYVPLHTVGLYQYSL